MKRHLTMLMLAAAFACACAVMFVAVWGRPHRHSREAEKRVPSVLWRTQMRTSPNTPCAFPMGWVVTDEAGGVTALSKAGKPLWTSVFSNLVFSSAASYASGFIVVVSLDGAVMALGSDTGKVVWKKTLDARFQHAPLIGFRGDVTVLWLVSQSDGQLVCLRVSDGTLVWKSETTNRCDGTPMVSQGRIAYGNCDGAVYVFDAANGALQGSVPVGESDQMAGGILALSQDVLLIGTRGGNLAVVDVAARVRMAVVNVSSSEAFVTPVKTWGGLVAMGSSEGVVSFWRWERGALMPAGRLALGAPIDSLQSFGGRLYVLSGGSLCALSSVVGPVWRLPLGDNVQGLVSDGEGALACVADGAVVSVKGDPL